jgi:hypothetical protein
VEWLFGWTENGVKANKNIEKYFGPQKNKETALLKSLNLLIEECLSFSLL